MRSQGGKGEQGKWGNGNWVNGEMRKCGKPEGSRRACENVTRSNDTETVVLVRKM